MFKRIAIACLIGMVWSSSAQAGAWLQEPGHGLFLLQGTYFTSDEFYDYNSHLNSQSRYTKYELQPYVEYGVLSNLTVGATGFMQRDVQSGNTNDGLADPSIFARTTVWKDAHQLVSLQPLLKFESQFEHDGSPRGGTSSTDAELSVLYGRNLEIVSPSDYLDVDVDYRFRGGPLNDQVHASVALGLQVAPRWQIVPAVRGTLATSLPVQTFSESGDLDYDLLKVELGAVYHVSDTQTVSLTAFDLAYGVQTGNGEGVTISFGQKF